MQRTGVSRDHGPWEADLSWTPVFRKSGLVRTLLAQFKESFDAKRIGAPSDHAPVHKGRIGSGRSGRAVGAPRTSPCATKAPARAGALHTLRDHSHLGAQPSPGALDVAKRRECCPPRDSFSLSANRTNRRSSRKRFSRSSPCIGTLNLVGPDPGAGRSPRGAPSGRALPSHGSAP